MIYVAANSTAEVLGRNILMYLSGMGSFEQMGRTILKLHQIGENPIAENWYNHQKFLDSLKDIYTRTGPNTIGMIGKRIAENAKFPPDVKTLEQALFSMERSYQTVHKGDTKSTKKVVKLSDKSFKVTINSPYPCELDNGYLRGLSNRFTIPNATVSVVHDDTQPCRKNGGESCTYIVSWE